MTFFNPQVENDTVRAFNGTVLLWKDRSFTAKIITTDTVCAYKISSDFKGMIPVGTGFYFANKEPTPSFSIGLKYSDLPAGTYQKDVRMFRDSAGVLLIEHDAILDTLNKTVSIKTSNLEFPFQLMIDTQMPSLSFSKDTGSFALPGVDINDTCTIADNIANVKWTYIFGKGDEIPTHTLSDILSNYQSTIALKILSSDQVINTDCGVRAYLIVTDGTFTDTIDLSRQVKREFSDGLTTTQLEWYPLSITGPLDNDQPEPIIAKLSNSEDTTVDMIIDTFAFSGGIQIISTVTMTINGWNTPILPVVTFHLFPEE